MCSSLKASHKTIAYNCFLPKYSQAKLKSLVVLVNILKTQNEEFRKIHWVEAKNLKHPSLLDLVQSASPSLVFNGSANVYQLTLLGGIPNTQEFVFQAQETRVMAG